MSPSWIAPTMLAAGIGCLLWASDAWPAEPERQERQSEHRSRSGDYCR